MGCDRAYRKGLRPAVNSGMRAPVFGQGQKSEFSKDLQKDVKLEAGLAHNRGLQRCRRRGLPRGWKWLMAGPGAGGRWSGERDEIGSKSDLTGGL